MINFILTNQVARLGGKGENRLGLVYLYLYIVQNLTRYVSETIGRLVPLVDHDSGLWRSRLKCSSCKRVESVFLQTVLLSFVRRVTLVW